MEGLVNEMGFEEDFKEKLSDHDKRICEHDSRLNDQNDKISDLQIKSAGYAERFTSIDTQFSDIKVTLTRMENSSLQTSNFLMNAISQIAIGNSKSSNDIEKNISKGNVEITRTKMNNNLTIALKILGVISAIALGWISARYGISIK